MYFHSNAIDSNEVMMNTMFTVETLNGKEPNIDNYLYRVEGFSNSLENVKHKH